MNLVRTRQLLREDIDRDNPRESLVHILESVLELLSLPDNDFLWSSWKDEHEAKREIVELIATLGNGALPERAMISWLFVPTGPLQEVSLGSGWGDALSRYPRSTMKSKHCCGRNEANRRNQYLLLRIA